jgi:hypothetical protein
VLAEDPTAMTRMLKVGTARHGAFAPQRKGSPANPALPPQYLFAEEIWYLFLHLLIKFSFLLFFLRLSQKKSFRRAVYFVMGCNVFVTVGTWCLYSLQVRGAIVVAIPRPFIPSDPTSASPSKHTGRPSCTPT